MEKNSFVFLYKLVEGEASSSMGIACAKAVGFPADLLDRIALISKCIKDGSPIPALLKMSRNHLKKQAIAKELSALLMDHTDFNSLWRRLSQLSDHI